MGRTLPSTTQMVFGLISGLEPFYLTLCRSDQMILDEFFEAILFHRPAISNAASLLPMEIAPFVILLEGRKRIDKHFAEVTELINQLDNKLYLPSTPD